MVWVSSDLYSSSVFRLLTLLYENTPSAIVHRERDFVASQRSPESREIKSRKRLDSRESQAARKRVGCQAAHSANSSPY